MAGIMRFLRKIMYFVGWLLIVVVIALSLGPAAVRPETGVPRAVEHFSIFAAIGIAFSLGYGRRPIALMAALVGFAGAIELAQKLIPDRHARLTDFVIDAAAACIGTVLASIANRSRERHR